MVVVKLLGYALASVLMYWGLLLLLLGPVMVVVVVTVLANQAWNRVTGRQDEWTWLADGLDRLSQAQHRFKFEWVGWLPGIVIQIWYAGCAADLVLSSTVEASSLYAIAIHGMGVAGVAIAAAVFYWLYSQVVEVKLGPVVYPMVGAVALGAYFVLLQQPQTAAFLSNSWQQVFAAFAIAAI
jgi:hypothetical protein